MSHVYLIGFMGSGKSSVGRRLARRLGMPFVDLDQRIEQDAHTSISQIFTSGGEELFRSLETQALDALAEKPPSVVACGGGVVVTDHNRIELKRTGTVVYLKVNAAEALARIADKSTRPLLAGGGGATAATALLDARTALYEAVSDIAVDTVGLNVDEVVDRVAHELDAEESA